MEPPKTPEALDKMRTAAKTFRKSAVKQKNRGEKLEASRLKKVQAREAKAKAKAESKPSKVVIPKRVKKPKAPEPVVPGAAPGTIGSKPKMFSGQLGYNSAPHLAIDLLTGLDHAHDIHSEHVKKAETHRLVGHPDLKPHLHALREIPKLRSEIHAAMNTVHTKDSSAPASETVASASLNRLRDLHAKLHGGEFHEIMHPEEPEVLKGKSDSAAFKGRGKVVAVRQTG